MTCPTDTNTVAFSTANQVARQGIDMIAARTLGRPKDMEKRCAILDAALFLFAERGVDGVPMEAIAASAGVSKVTVYANFKDKNAIIIALVERETCRIDTLVAEAVQTEGALAQKLTRVGTLLIELISEPSRQALERCLSLEKQRNPELARAFFNAGPGHVRDLLANLLAEAMDCGVMNLDCARAAAEDLLGLWLGFSAIEGRYLARPPQTEFLQQRVQRGVDFFMRAHVEKATSSP